MKLSSLVKTAAIKGLVGPTTATIPSVQSPMTVEDVASIDYRLKPGDILLSSHKDKPFYNGLIGLMGSQFSHAALYLGEDQMVSAGHQNGTRQTELFQNGTHFALVRPTYPDNEAREKTLSFALEAAEQERGYDFLGDGQEGRLNCTSLVAEALQAGQPDLAFEEKSLLGHSYILPDAFLSNPATIVLESQPLDARKNLVGALPVLCTTAVGGGAGGWGANAIQPIIPEAIPNTASTVAGVALGALTGYALAGLAVILREVSTQDPIHLKSWRKDVKELS